MSFRFEQFNELAAYISNLYLRYIDHGDGTLTLRIQDPFVFDSGRYSCVITTPAGDVETECDVEIEEFDESLSEEIPVFVKFPLPAISLPGNSASFCARVTPIDSNVTWSICGREITNDMKGFVVSLNILYI